MIALPQPDLPEKMLLGNVFSLYLHIKNNLIAFVFVSELSVKEKLNDPLKNSIFRREKQSARNFALQSH